MYTYVYIYIYIQTYLLFPKTELCKNTKATGKLESAFSRRLSKRKDDTNVSSSRLA